MENTYVSLQKNEMKNDEHKNDEKTEKASLFGMFMVAFGIFLCTLACGILMWKIDVSTTQITLFQYGLTLLYTIIHWNLIKIDGHFWGNSWYEFMVIFFRGFNEVLCFYLYFYALKYVGVGDIEAIFLFTSPLMVAFIGRVVFKEKLPKCISIVIIINIIGAILITQPTFIPIFNDENASISYIGIAIISASIVGYTIDVVIVDRHSDIHILKLQFGSSIFGVFVFIPILYGLNYLFTNDNNDLIGNSLQWDMWSIIISFIVGGFSFIGTLCLNIGYQIGVSTKVVWLEYFNLIWAYGIQWIIFKRISNYFEIIGASLIFTTALIQFYNQYQEYLHEKKVQQSKQQT